MKILGIDLSLRSSGLVFIEKNNTFYKLVCSSNKDLNDEELLIFNKKKIKEFIEEHKPDHIAIEGLSFGSLSGSKDILAGNFWSIRTMIKEDYPNIKVYIVPVTSWRSKLFTKEENKQRKDYETKVKQIKIDVKKMDKQTKTKFLLENEHVIHGANIKYLTWNKVPEPLKSQFEVFGFTKGTFDLTDAYWIAKHIENIG